MNATWEVICPACGALVEADDRNELVTRAREHTVDAHRYAIPRQHVVDSATRSGAVPATTRCHAGDGPFSWETA